MTSCQLLFPIDNTVCLTIMSRVMVTQNRKLVEDDERIEMMQGYIDYMLKAMEDGCNVRGYYAWSTMDLYSWVNGYEKRYGLVRVDFDDHNRRYPKKSYYWFKKLIEDYRKAEEE